MKLIISKGKFEVSVEALKRLIAGNSKAVVKLNKEKFREGQFGIKKNFEMSEDVGDGYKQLNMDGFIHKFTTIFKDDDNFMYAAKLVRDCPVFISVVENMGGDRAGLGCILKVVEVPDNIPPVNAVAIPDTFSDEDQWLAEVPDYWDIQKSEDGNEYISIHHHTEERIE